MKLRRSTIDQEQRKQPVFKTHLIILPLFASAIPLIAYLLTAYPDVGHTDSGELVAASWTLGIAHAPGFPSYVLLGWLWMHLFSAPSAAVMNAFSALMATLAGTGLFLSLFHFYRRSAPSQWLAISLALLGAMLFWQSDLLWRWATTAEVYALNSLLLAMILWLLQIRQRYIWLWIGVLWGISLHTHLVSALFFFPLIASTFWKRKRKGQWQFVASEFRQFVLAAGVVYLAGAAFLFFRAQANPPINWGDPATLERLWYHLTAKQYQVNLFQASFQRRLELFKENLELLNGAVSFISLLLAIGGFIVLWQRHHRPWFYGILLSITFGLLYSASYDIAQDRDAYLLPVLLLICFLAPVGLGQLLEKWKAVAHKSLALLLVLPPLIAGILRFPALDRSEIRITPAFVQQSLAPIDSTALVLTGNWQLYSPFLYFHIVQQRYPHIIMIDLPLWQNRAWYVEQIQQRYPQLTRQWEPALSHFLRYLRQFERDELRSTVEIERWYQRLLDAMVNRTAMPVFLDLSAVRHLQKYHVFHHLPVPNQLLFQYRPIPSENIPFQTDIPLPPSNVQLDPVEEEILQLYQAMQSIHETFLNPRPRTE